VEISSPGRAANEPPRPRFARLAEVVSEVAGPAPLLLIGLLQVGLPSGAVAATIVSVITMAILPYGATVWLARAGRLSGRFVSNRRQRIPILLGTLVVVVVGAVVTALIGAPRPLLALAVLAVVTLAVVSIVTLRWKLSIHATLAVFFAGLQVSLYGAIGILALAIPAAVMWARFHLRAHTLGELAAGCVLGAVMSVAYAIAIGAT
jgi:hypothetical protein